MPLKYHARLCKLYKWDGYRDYGFSLQATKGKVGHFISDVDPLSPAFAGGLRDKDFVVEVNGINVLSEPHNQVVDRIKELRNQVTLLVLDSDARAYFEETNAVVDGHMESLQRLYCPTENPHLHREDGLPSDITSPTVSDVSTERLESEWNAIWTKCCQENRDSTMVCHDEDEGVVSPGQLPSNPVNPEESVHSVVVAQTEQTGEGPATKLEVVHVPVEQMEQIEPNVAPDAVASSEEQQRVEADAHEKLTKEAKKSGTIEIIRVRDFDNTAENKANDLRSIIVERDSAVESQAHEAIEQIDREVARGEHSIRISSLNLERGTKTKTNDKRERIESTQSVPLTPNTVVIESNQIRGLDETDKDSSLKLRSTTLLGASKQNVVINHNDDPAVGLPTPVTKSENPGVRRMSNSNTNGQSAQVNEQELCDDLAVVKMRCASRGRKNRKPTSTFTERKKMFDQL
ncbi:Na(+)/H(+) exchange regulatory cofactor NHE-RF [Fasciola hepatica]|uniref:Na(+)/H(+) exchange regulatory cofactor NHE-RF n=1 Tax=Fasciola hepatica TaxID=6192 RepID=A0A4E0RU00_FASHE|nr:Na(+)/H(+) exchange regulatory cofactor NHE-RF [Fasciola hepatica]